MGYWVSLGFTMRVIPQLITSSNLAINKNWIFKQRRIKEQIIYLSLSFPESEAFSIFQYPSFYCFSSSHNYSTRNFSRRGK